MKTLRLIAAAAAVATIPCAAKADWIPISESRMVIAWDSPQINSDGSRDVRVFFADLGVFNTWRYSCASPHYFVAFRSRGAAEISPLVRGSAPEVGYGMAALDAHRGKGGEQQPLFEDKTMNVRGLLVIGTTTLALGGCFSSQCEKMGFGPEGSADNERCAFLLRQDFANRMYIASEQMNQRYGPRRY